MQLDQPRPNPNAPAPQVLIVHRSGSTFTTEVTPADISEILKNPDEFIWLDLCNPGDDEIALLREEFGFHALAIEDAIRHNERPKVESFDTYYFLVFYTLEFVDGRLRAHPISLFVGANYLVSVHVGDIRVIDETIARWQRNEEGFGTDSGALLYALFDAIVDDYFPVIDQLADRVEAIEEQIFATFQPSALQEIFTLKRDLLAMRRVAAPERDVLNILIRREVPVFERNSILYLQDVYDHIIRVTDSIDTYRDLLSSALDAFLSLQSNRLNQVVTLLTIASIVLMTNALIAGIYGMNFDAIPELHWPLGYPYAIGLMIVVSLTLVIFFRRRRWL